ncbi:MAG: hypothetical protein IT458_10830 [Planctomycetes bacterium]|nr:hypothetical protein [Planctomycetota bacterium]
MSDENGRAWFEVRSGESSTTMRLGGGAEYGAEFVCNEKSASMQIGGADGASAFIEADDQRGRVAFGVRGSAGSVETMVDKELGHGVIIRDAARRTRGFIGASGGETTSVGVTMQQYADKSSKSPNAVVTLTADRSGTARCAVGGATERDVELSAGADASAVVTNGKDGGVSLRARADRSEIIVDGPGSSGWRGEWTLTDRIMKLVGRRKDGKWSAFEMVFDDVLRVIFRAMDGRKNEILWPDK